MPPPSPSWRRHSPGRLSGAAAEVADDAARTHRSELLGAAARAVSSLVAGAPTLLVVDDIHWADVPSLLLLAHIEPLLRTRPVLVVATVRTGEADAASVDVLADLRRTATVVAVGGITADAVATLLASSGLAVDTATAAALTERTGGNPFFITELARAARVASPSQFDVGTTVLRDVPPQVADVVRRRVARIPSPAADLLAAAAVLGPDGDVALLAATA